MDVQEINRQRSIAMQDLIMAARGHLNNEDWDNEMREALGLLADMDREMYKLARGNASLRKGDSG